MPAAEPLIVGLAGGVASGKSTFAGLLAGDDGAVIDADAFARDVQRDPAVVSAIESALGAPVRAPDGALDREAVARLVFADPRRREAIEKVVHPRVTERIDRRLAELRAQAARTGRPRIVVLDVPLLFEGGLVDRCSRVVFVDSDPTARRARARAERGWDDAEVGRRDAHQISLEEKRRRSHLIARNEGTLDALRHEAERVRKSLLPAPPQSH